MSITVKIAVAGAGAIGLRHIDKIRQTEGVTLAGIVDPVRPAGELAQKLNSRWFDSVEALITAGEVDGVILALPTQMHVDAGLACLEAGLPVLIEKPLADTVAAGLLLVEGERATGVPILTGHHRRYMPLVEKAKQLIDSGHLGQLTSVQAQTWFCKPDAYFEPDWRRAKGAGPILTNLIHDIEILQYLCGPVEMVQAMETNAARGHEVEDAAVILLQFENGILGTLNVSDATVSPWSWELTARENPAYPATSENCYWIGGTHGSLALPSLSAWHHEGEPSWLSPISETRRPFDFEDPLARQIRHFAAVIRGDEPPHVTSQHGLSALQVIDAIKSATTTGQRTLVDRSGGA